MFLMMFLFLGCVASFRLPVDTLPTIEYPILTVSVSYKGAGPQQVEVAVTKPLEGVLSMLEGVDRITSYSREGSASIRLQYKWGVDLDKAIFDVRERIDMVRDMLPDDVTSVRIVKYSNDDDPILGFMIVGIDDSATAFDFADNYIRKNMESIEGVGQVRTRGGIQTEIQVELLKNRLQAYNLNADEVGRVVANNNTSTSGGYVYQGVNKIGIRMDGELQNINEVRNIVVDYKGGVPILLKDIATVSYGSNEDNGINYVTAPYIEDESPDKTGRTMVTIEVYKTSVANTIDVEKNVQEYIKELSTLLPPNVHIIETFNNATDIRNAVQGLINSGLQGGIFALLVLFLYLWDWKSLLVIGVSIPASVVTTFIVMYFFDVSFNTISLAGLTLAIGMMVDSSIVVLENIFQYRKKHGKYNASILGTKEVSLAITASTFTTISVFFPILFLEGQSAQLFRDLVITVVAGLLVSLITSITVVPMLISLFDHKDKENPLTVLKAIDTDYHNTLLWCLNYKKRIVFISILVVCLGVFGITKLMDRESIPASDSTEMVVSLIFPDGTKYQENERVSRGILKEVKGYLGDNAKLINLRVKVNWGSAVFENRSIMRITLIPKTQRKATIEDLVEGVREIVAKYPVKTYINTGNRGGGNRGESIQINVQGNELAQSHDIAYKIIELIEDLPYIRNPRNTSDDPTIEINLKPNRVALAREGITTSQLFNVIQMSFGGRNVSSIMGSMGNDIDIRVRIREEDRHSVESLNSFSVVVEGNRKVPLSTLVDITQEVGTRDIERADNIRIVDIRAAITGEYTKNVVGAVENIIELINQNIFIPVGTTLDFRGAYKDAQDSINATNLAIMVAIFIVYALMAALFESFVAPFVIMVSVPFGLFGSLILLYLTNNSLNTYSMIGMVILVGIVINNGIVLVDYTNTLLSQGVAPIKAVSDAGFRRLRPVCMTTFTTILGMFPMALGLGEGGEQYAPLAISVIGGLAISTLFTLFIVPLLYGIVLQIKSRFKKSY